jgi:5-methylcytosine-specific restriction endonuclease McrA
MADADFKRCTKCGETKTFSCFCKKSRPKDGLSQQCKDCTRAAAADYHARNKDRLNAKSAARYAANPERKKAYLAARYQANRERLDPINAAWAKSHPERRAEWSSNDYYKHKEKRLATAKRWRASNPELASQISREWKERNPEAAAALRRNYKARKREAEGHHTGDDIKMLMAAQRGKCAYCFTKLLPGFHVDHIEPLSKGGSNWPSNLQLLCAQCNLSKRDKLPHVFAQESGRLL